MISESINFHRDVLNLEKDNLIFSNFFCIYHENFELYYKQSSSFAAINFHSKRSQDFLISFLSLKFVLEIKISWIFKDEMKRFLKRY